MNITQGMINVRVTTTSEHFKAWNISVEVPRTMKIRDFRNVLASPPYSLNIAPTIRLSQRGMGSALSETDMVKPYLSLQNYVPTQNPILSKPIKSVLKDLVTELPDAEKFITVKLTTTADDFEKWSLSVEVLETTTLMALKQMLMRAPYNLPITRSQKVLFRLDEDHPDPSCRGHLARLLDHELVTSELVLLEYLPERKVQTSTQQMTPYADQHQHEDNSWSDGAEALVKRYINDHASLPPLDRRASSWWKTIRQAVIVMLNTGNLLIKEEYTADNPLVIWILQATDSDEGYLLEQGHFDDDTNVGSGSRFYPMQIHMMGERLRDFTKSSIGKGAATKLHKFSYDNMVQFAEARKPDLVILFNVEFRSTRADGKPMQVPQHVLEAAKHVPTVISFRFKLWDASIKTMDKTLGQSLLFTPLRNPFSAMAGNTRFDYDDNGWIVGLRNLQALPDLLALDLRPPFPESRDPENKLVAIFWGIIDLKYDADSPIFERIKVLESGDGRNSKFSHHGEEIPKRFRARHRLEDFSGSGRHTVVSNNKKLTHDEIVSAGYEHLVPKQLCLLREYDARLADRIIDGLGCKPGDIVVLKLCNRARAAGVIPVPTDELDEVLEELLQVPEDMETWFQRKLKSGSKETLQVPWGSYEEEYRHWWSNECPFFVAERCCQSMPMTSDVDGKLYDGTLRVAFALRRTSLANKAASIESLPPEDQLEIEWLGGYWKLPKEDIYSSKLRERIISAARTKGTRPICLAHLHEIYAGLGHVVHCLFSLGGPEPSLWKKYEYSPVMAAYLTARLSVTLRDISRCRQTMNLARTLLAKVEAGFPKSCIESYVHRGLGVFDAMQPPGWWKEALESFSTSLDFMPSNATSWYLKGMALLELDRVEEAIESMKKSLLLDLDFKAPYVNLGVAWLRMSRWDAAIEISEALLLRYPDSPQCHYHIGVSCFMKSQELQDSVDGDADKFSEEEAASYKHLRERAQEAFLTARESEEGQRLQLRIPVVSPWLAEDDLIGNMLRPCFNVLGKRNVIPLKSRNEHITLPANVGWRFYGWRT